MRLEVQIGTGNTETLGPYLILVTLRLTDSSFFPFNILDATTQSKCKCHHTISRHSVTCLDQVTGAQCDQVSPKLSDQGLAREPTGNLIFILPGLDQNR